MKPIADMTIIVDTREQLAYSWPGWSTISHALPTGDYSIEGLEHLVAIERKSLPDMYQCIGRERDRFERELARLAELDFAAIVIEASMADVLAGLPQSAVNPRSAIGSLLAWAVKFGVHVVFAGDRACGAATTRKLLVFYWKHRRPAVQQTSSKPAPTKAGRA